MVYVRIYPTTIINTRVLAQKTSGTQNIINYEGEGNIITIGCTWHKYNGADPTTVQNRFAIGALGGDGPKPAIVEIGSTYLNGAAALVISGVEYTALSTQVGGVLVPALLQGGGTWATSA
jgi:hypothetical protein